MRNLNGTSVTTDQAVMAFGTLPLFFMGGGEANAVESTIDDVAKTGGLVMI